MASSASEQRKAKVESAAQPARRILQTFWFNLIVAVVVLALIQTFVGKIYYVPSGSMERTLGVGDRVLISRVAYFGSSPETGDVIVFNASDAWRESPKPPAGPLKYAAKWLGGVVGLGSNLDHTLVKRVIAGPGQTVACCGDGGEMLVDGEALSEPYVTNDFDFVLGQIDCSTTPMSRRCVPEFTVPDGQYVVLGDNRSVSSDSLYQCRGAPELGTCVRTVKREDIVGKLFVIVWPLSRAGVPEGP